MYYYDIATPIKLRINLTYKHPEALAPGIRVIVSVGRNLYTGVVIRQTPQGNIDPNIRYKSIIEVVDTEPIMSNAMLRLAKWMSDYYKTSHGIVVDTILPLALKIEIAQKVRLKNELEANRQSNETEKRIVDLLKTTPIMSEAENWVPISTLREKIKANDFYHIIESLEKEQTIEVYRTFDEKIKPKYANYVKIVECCESSHSLTTTQQVAFEMICEKIASMNPPPLIKEITLSSLTADISYSIIKALKNKKIIEVYPKKIETDLFNFPERQTPKEITLNPEQISAIDKICLSLDKKMYHTYLLFGVTGSGKTEVYIHAILHAQKLGKSALMLVPEISLTPQTIHRFYHVFGKDIAVLHSNLNDRERYLQWKSIHSGKIKIVIGARSAVFAPLKNIGIIIVDEEHESSYKQDHQPCYNGRDIAVMRGNIENAVVILGSATPSLESWNNSLKRKYSLITLTQRPANAIMPEVKIVDMKNEIKDSFFSAVLKEKIQEKLEKKEQIILFHNRRGYSSYVQCVQCGVLFRCPACDISMNYHKSHNMVVCHYCGHNEEIARKCKDCSSYHFIYGAPGTEQIEAQLKILFPSAKVLRMDSDTTKKKNSFSDMFDAMREHHIDILLGTQMISKGLDFHNVTLVGVVLADVTLNIPDFRSAEKTFQLLTQVAGRSGRGDKKGEVIIQSLNPDHYALTCAANQDFLAFSHKEIIARAEVFYPPKYRLCRILFSCPDHGFLKDKLVNSQTLLIRLKLCFPEEEFILLPFIEAPLPKIQNKYRYHLIIKSAKIEYIQKFLDMFIVEFDCPNKIQMTVDIDPLSLL
jgi:primosomal protein N' (replication factor Y)